MKHPKVIGDPAGGGLVTLLPGERFIPITDATRKAFLALTEIAFACGVNANAATTPGERSRWVKVYDKASAAARELEGVS